MASFFVGGSCADPTTREDDPSVHDGVAAYRRLPRCKQFNYVLSLLGVLWTLPPSYTCDINSS